MLYFKVRPSAECGHLCGQDLLLSACVALRLALGALLTIRVGLPLRGPGLGPRVAAIRVLLVPPGGAPASRALGIVMTH